MGAERPHWQALRQRQPRARTAAEIGLAVTGGVLVGLAVAVVGTSADDRTLYAVLAGIAVLAAVAYWPALPVVAVLALCQEVDPHHGLGRVFPSTSVGHQAFFTSSHSLTAFTALAILAVGVALFRAWPQTPRLTPALSLAGLLGVWCALLAWQADINVSASILLNGRFAVLFVAAFLLGRSLSRDRPVGFANLLIALIAALAVYAIWAAGTGHAAKVGSSPLVFYDSATGALAVAAMLAVLITPGRDVRYWLLAGAAAIVVVLSARRNVYIGGAAALTVALLAMQTRSRIAVRIAAIAVLALVAVRIMLPDTFGHIGELLGSLGGHGGSATVAASTQGHFDDVRVGWDAVQRHPIGGIGVNATIPSLVVIDRTLYIHNEFLQTWLRYGIVAVLLLAALLAFLAWQAIRTLRRRKLRFVDRWAALLLLLTPVAMMTAPFFSTTQRWPALIGLAAGVLADRDTQQTAPP